MNAGDERWLEYLAAYADGELDAATAARVEGWLAIHPDALDILRSQEAFSPRQLDFIEAIEPPAPNADDWEECRQRIAAAVLHPTMLPPAPPPLPSAHSPVSWRTLGGCVAMFAAAILVAVAWPTIPPALEIPTYAVADDVDILSLRDQDAEMVLVGVTPEIQMPLWASSDDVVFDWVEPDPQGHLPVFQAGPNAGPMVVMPMLVER